MNGIDFLIDVAERAAARPEEYLLAGSNGPYCDNDTKVRCCSHWLITFSRCFDWTGDDRFRENIVELAQFLCSKQARPYGYTFLCRDRKNNLSNGLIGTAWVLEALAEATRKLNDPKYSKTGCEVALLHPFDEQRGLWRRVDVDGRVFQIECTFNHQLWFAASVTMLINADRDSRLDADALRWRIHTFLDKIKDNLSLSDNGMINHLIQGTNMTTKPASLRRKLSRLARRIGSNRQVQPKWKYNSRVRLQQSSGYHAFNMYGFTLLRQQQPSHPFWQDSLYGRAEEHLLSDEHARNLESNRFGYPYNPIGFEIPFVLASTTRTRCDALASRTELWINKQLREHYNWKTMKMDRNTEDPITLTARLYELARLDRQLLSRVQIQSVPGR